MMPKIKEGRFDTAQSSLHLVTTQVERASTRGNKGAKVEMLLLCFVQTCVAMPLRGNLE